MRKPRIFVISLGGTITMTKGAGAGITPTLTGADLVETIPALQTLADVETLSLFGLPGASLTQAHLITVANTIKERFANGADGAVVIQGTDTIEDTAFALDVLVKDDRPIVVTGAMRGAESPGADGPANILSAIIAAGSSALHGLGTTVVLNDQIHAACLAQKSNTALPSAFTSPSAGPIGLVAEGAARIFLRPTRTRLSLDLSEDIVPSAVALVSLGLGEDGRILSALPELGYAGAVIEGMGAGHIPSAAVQQVSELTARMPVVLSTRVRSGPVFTKTYGFAGSEIDLISRGLIPAGSISASKARLLLSFLLSASRSRTEISDAFQMYSSHSVA